MRWLKEEQAVSDREREKPTSKLSWKIYGGHQRKEDQRSKTKTWRQEDSPDSKDRDSGNLISKARKSQPVYDSLRLFLAKDLQLKYEVQEKLGSQTFKRKKQWSDLWKSSLVVVILDGERCDGVKCVN